jgi:hypothetical protein
MSEWFRFERRFNLASSADRQNNTWITSKPVDRTAKAPEAQSATWEITGHFNILLSEEGLNRSDVVAALKQVCGERVAEDKAKSLAWSIPPSQPRLALISGQATHQCDAVPVAKKTWHSNALDYTSPFVSKASTFLPTAYSVNYWQAKIVIASAAKQSQRSKAGIAFPLNAGFHSSQWQRTAIFSRN